MGKMIDLTGQTFGKWKVLSLYDKDHRGEYMWNCECECGTISNIHSSHLRRGHSTRCIRCNTRRYFNRDGYMVGLTRKNQEFYFSIEDLEVVGEYPWSIDSCGYATTTVKGKTVRFHKLIIESNGLEVDHINSIKIDNRRENLRITTHECNTQNQSKQKRITSSKYKGVAWYKRDSKWRVSIKHKNKNYHLGYFINEDDAAKAYNVKAIELFGEYSKLNKIRAF